MLSSPNAFGHGDFEDLEDLEDFEDAEDLEGFGASATCFLLIISATLLNAWVSSLAPMQTSAPPLLSKL